MSSLQQRRFAAVVSEVATTGETLFSQIRDSSRQSSSQKREDHDARARLSRATRSLPPAWTASKRGARSLALAGPWLVRLLRDPRPFAGRSKDRPLHESDVGHALQGVPRVSGPMGCDTSRAPLKADTTNK